MMPRTETPDEGFRRLRRRPGLTPQAPQAEDPRRRARRARRHRRARARAGPRHPGLARQAVPDPLGVDGADPRRRPAGPRQPLPLPLHRSRDRRHRRLPPPGRARTTARECGVPHGPRAACPRPDPGPSPTQNFIKRIVAGPGDTLCVQNGHPVVNGKSRARRLHPALRCGAESAICRRRSRSHPTITS